MELNLLDGDFAICKLEPQPEIPNWATGDLVMLTIDQGGATVVCRQHKIPASIEANRDWRCFQVVGQLDFELTGIIAELTTHLSSATIPVYVISTFETDYVLVKSADSRRASEVLETIGHQVRSAD